MKPTDKMTIEELIEEKLLQIFEMNIDNLFKETTNVLAWLIAEGKLELKIASSEKGLYHEKFGIMYDEEENIVVFSGSANETFKGLKDNFESIDVYQGKNIFEKELWYRKELHYMNVELAKTAGFCFGVKRAVDTVYKQIEKHQSEKIFTYGPIIHNEEVIKDLRSHGVEVLNDEEELKTVDADVVVIGPKESYVIDVKDFVSKGKNTPFQGKKVNGKVKVTICGGRVVYEDK